MPGLAAAEMDVERKDAGVALGDGGLSWKARRADHAVPVCVSNT